ncbi:MAG TPA: hypothetical protein VF112_09750 [Candidatus Dormibacteraeota bacterium]
MAQPEWHRHPGVLVAARGVAPSPVPAFVVGPASGGRRPLVVLAVLRPGTDEWVPFVARPEQVLTTWAQWRSVIRGALEVHPSTEVAAGHAAPPRAVAAAG